MLLMRVRHSKQGQQEIGGQQQRQQARIVEPGSNSVLMIESWLIDSQG